jgi:hypothetical protein
MSETPRTDEIERKHGLAWFGLNDEQGRYLDGMVKFRELARTLERELAEAEETIERKHQMVVSYERTASELSAYAKRARALLSEAMLSLHNRPMSIRVMSDSRLREAIASHLYAQMEPSKKEPS